MKVLIVDDNASMRSGRSSSLTGRRGIFIGHRINDDLRRKAQEAGIRFRFQ